MTDDWRQETPDEAVVEPEIHDDEIVLPAPADPPPLLAAPLSKLDQRLVDLAHAIATYPDAAVNYVTRGELYLHLGEFALAAADLRQGLALAQAEMDARAWGIVAQAMQERALKGLEQAERRLKRSNAVL
jgi:tetratricopeptide (TPR) repeat protein